MDQINKQASLWHGNRSVLGYGYGCKRRPRRHGIPAQPSVVIAENGAVEVQVSVAEDVFTGIKVGDTASVTVSAVSRSR